MKKVIVISVVLLVGSFSILIIFFQPFPEGKENMKRNDLTVKLPGPHLRGDTSIEEALQKRRSVRDYSSSPMELQELSQLLWAAQGVTRDNFFRTAPSAGALYPVEIYIAAGSVKSLKPGVYSYLPGSHSLQNVSGNDVRAELCRASLGQGSVKQGSVVFIISVVYERVTGKYDDRGIRYAHIEAGSVAQNVYLQAVSLNLGTVLIGAFHDERVREVVGMKRNEVPLCVMPLGNVLK